MKHIAFSGCRDIDLDEDDIVIAYNAFSKLYEFDGEDRYGLFGDCPTGADRSLRIYFKPTPDMIFKADWDAHGKAAGPIRNKTMIDKADGLIAFWDGKSRGTKNCIECATDKGIPVLIIPINKNTD